MNLREVKKEVSEKTTTVIILEINTSH